MTRDNSTSDPDDLDDDFGDDQLADAIEQLRFQVGRRAPYTQVGDWVLLAPIRHPARVLYWALSAHINVSRGNTVVWPTQDDLAAMIGYSEGRKVRGFLDELVDLGALEVMKDPELSEGARERSLYTVHQSPPPGYDGLVSLEEFYGARRAARRAAIMARRQSRKGDKSS